MVLVRLKESTDLAPTWAWLARLRGEFNKGTMAPASSSALTSPPPPHFLKSVRLVPPQMLLMVFELLPLHGHLELLSL